ncbi:MAG: hypothetical protein AAF938_22720, partial [Myxococcota bacterium]
LRFFLSFSYESVFFFPFAVLHGRFASFSAWFSALRAAEGGRCAFLPCLATRVRFHLNSPRRVA